MIVVFLIVLCFMYFMYGLLVWLKTLYIIIRLLSGNENKYFFRLMDKLIVDSENVIAFNGSDNEFIVTIIDDHGRTYLLDIDLNRERFYLTMKTNLTDTYIFGEDLSVNENEKLRSLIEIFKVKEEQRKYFNKSKYKNI